MARAPALSLVLWIWTTGASVSHPGKWGHYSLSRVKKYIYSDTCSRGEENLIQQYCDGERDQAQLQL